MSKAGLLYSSLSAIQKRTPFASASAASLYFSPAHAATTAAPPSALDGPPHAVASSAALQLHAVEDTGV